MLTLVSTLALALPTGEPLFERPPATGWVKPYSLEKVFRGFGRCKRGKRQHAAIDLGGVGPDWGLGTPIVSMATSRVTRIGTGFEKPGVYGYPDKRSGNVRRGRWRLPRQKTLPVYGLVYFFTRNYGYWRTGTLVEATVVEGALAGHVIRYMHLGAVHPALKVGSIIEKGQEIGVMGGTAVQIDAPHLHVDITRPDGSRVDMKWLFSIASRHLPRCWKRKKRRKSKARRSKKARTRRARKAPPR